MNLSPLTPAEVDAMWHDAMAPFRAKFERANALDSTAAKYRKYGGKYIEQADDYAQQAHVLRQATIVARAAVEAPFLAEWHARGGWTRAYIVPDGHIHKSTSCHSLHPTTIIGWIPEQSGMTEAEIVEAAGVHACTICYPSAPVDALRAALAAAKAEGECPGSRTYDHDSSGLMYYSPRAKCNHCHRTVSATKTGKLRAHKAQA